MLNQVGRFAAQLREAADELKLYNFSGLFPEIGHAWMTIDHRLFLWDYRVPNATPYTYDGLDQVVITAALARPRRDGTFDPAPDWLLLLSTPLEVVVLAIYCTGPRGRETSQIDIHETGFSVPSDGVNLVRMGGSASGLRRERAGHSHGSLYFFLSKSKVKTDRQGVDRDREHETHNHFLGGAFPIGRNGVGGLLQAQDACT